MWIMVEPVAEIPFGICRSPMRCYGCNRKPEQKAIVSSAIEAKSGFSKCLGSGGGSQIQFSELPLLDGEQFQSCKKLISMRTLYFLVICGY
jgi:hypothetical protein